MTNKFTRLIFSLFLAFSSLFSLASIPTSAADLFSISFERTNETPVSVEFRVTVVNNGSSDLNNLPLNILFSGIDQSQIKEVAIDSVSVEKLTKEEPITAEIEKRYKPVGKVFLNTDSDGNLCFTDVSLAKGESKLILGSGEVVEGTIIQSGQYEYYDEKTGEYVWHETEVTGYKEVSYLQEDKSLLQDFKVKPASKLATSFSQPSILRNDYGFGNGIRVFDVTINTGSTTNGEGWGSKGLMIWDVNGIQYYDNQHSSWWNNSWQYRQKLTFNNGTIAENLVNFPVGIFLNSSNFNFSQAQSAGQDIRFVDADETTALKYEIVSWNSTSAELYVKVPQIDASSSTDYIWMYWGNSTCTDGSDKTSVWDSSYISVYHMNNKSGDSTKLPESTAYAREATKGAGAQAPAETTGLVGKAQQFNLANKTYAATSAYSLGSSGTLTFNFMLNTNDTRTPQIWMGEGINSGTTGFIDILILGDKTIHYQYANGTNVVHAILGSFASYFGAPTLLTFVANYTANTVTLYINGAYSTQQTMTTPLYPSTSRAKYIGNYSSDYAYGWNGTIDHLDISNTGRSAGWIAATNKSLRNTYVNFIPNNDTLTTHTLMNTILQTVLAIGLSISAMFLMKENSNWIGILVTIIIGIVSYIIIGDILGAFGL